MNLSPGNSFFKIFLVIVSAAVIAGCSRQTKQGKLLASANGSSLHMNDVAAHVDTSSAYAVRNYVSHWVDEQLLFDEAKRLGLEDSREFKDRVQEFSTQLAITMLLDKTIYGASPAISPDDIAAYYKEHRQEFIATDEVTYINLAAFDRRTVAVAFRNALVSGTSWSDAFRDIPAFEILEAKDSAYVQSAGVAPAIWNVIQSLEAGHVSFPIQAGKSNYVVQLLGRINPGDPLPMSYASPRIIDRLTIEKREEMYHALLDSLRSAGNFQIDPSVAIRDTNSQE